MQSMSIDKEIEKFAKTDGEKKYIQHTRQIADYGHLMSRFKKKLRPKSNLNLNRYSFKFQKSLCILHTSIGKYLLLQAEQISLKMAEVVFLNENSCHFVSCSACNNSPFFSA